MKYIITFTARRKDAIRHTIKTISGKPKIYETIESAEKTAKTIPKRYNVAIRDTRYNIIKKCN